MASGDSSPTASAEPATIAPRACRCTRFTALATTTAAFAMTMAVKAAALAAAHALSCLMTSAAVGFFGAPSVSPKEDHERDRHGVGPRVGEHVAPLLAALKHRGPLSHH